MAPTCASGNTAAVDQSNFWSSGNLNWDEHRIGWAIAGGCAALVSPSLVLANAPSQNFTFSDSSHLPRFSFAALSVSYW